MGDVDGGADEPVTVKVGGCAASVDPGAGTLPSACVLLLSFLMCFRRGGAVGTEGAEASDDRDELEGTAGDREGRAAWE